MRESGQTYVHVHGLFTGGWVWRFVADGLRSQGYRVLTPTPTGVGERAHHLSRQITLDTHIEDVLGVFDAEELYDLILVGHSAGGMIATGVADRIRSRIRHLIYLDALVPENGQTAFDLTPPGIEEERRKAAKNFGGGVAFPLPTAENLNLENSPRKDWFMSHLRPHPMGVYETPVRLSETAGAGLPVTYVAYTAPAYPSIEASRQRARTIEGWTYKELSAIHDAEVQQPAAVVELISDLG